MKGRIIALLLGVVLAISGCSSQAAETPAQTVETPDVETQVSDNTAYALPDDLIRSAATVVEDSKTQRTITSEDSYQIGTYIKISIYDEAQAPESIFDEIFYTIDLYEKMISKNIETSEVSQINANAGIQPVAVSDDLWALIKKGLAYSDFSDGKFDITVGPLVDLWGIGTDDARLPEPEEIAEKMKLINYKEVILDANAQTVYLERAGMEIDLGAIAKGFIADRIKEILIKRGYEHAIINLGGNVLTVGTKPNSDYWAVGVRDPNGEQSDIVGVLQLKDNSIVSSGVYERYFIQDGVRYHHILDPFTGYPADNHLLAISIVSDLSVDGDGLSTSLFVMGLKDAYAYAQTRDDIEVLFITDDNKIYYTDGLKDIFVQTNTLYENIGAFVE